MATSEKSRMIALRLAETLKVRVAPLALVESTGSAGDPLIVIGAGSAGGANAVIRVVPFGAPLAKDILGNASKVNTPHVVQLCTEANFAGTTDNVADVMTAQQLGNVLIDVFGAGATVEWYQTATGTAPTEAGITSGNLKGTFQQSQLWPLMGQ